MRRWCLLVISAALVLTAGCVPGARSYEDRLEHRLAQLERERRVYKNLMPAPDDKKFKDLSIYVRAPKEEAYAKTGQLPDEGQFELDASFLEKTDAALHLLARVKLPKKAPAKGAPPTPATAPRGDFTRDVLNALTAVYGQIEGFATPKFVDEKKGSNRFKRLVVTAENKEIRVYTYKLDNHEVALIFVYDPKLKGILSTKIDLCLETFATGAKATQIFNGGEADDDDTSGGGAAAVPM